MSKDFVLDGSATMAWFLRDERTEHSRQLYRLVVGRHVRPVVPELWHYETLNTLRTAVVRGRLREDTARRSAVVLERLPREVVSSEAQGRSAVLARALDLKLTAYDATYFHLAESRGIQLVTSDGHLLALRPRFGWIMTVEDFVRNVCAQPPAPE